MDYYTEIIVRKYFVGIISFGIGYGSLPSIYTRVAYYLEWIEPIVWSEL